MSNNYQSAPKAEKSELKIKEHLEFTGGTKCMFLNTIEISDMISQLFGSTFSDYYGCKVLIHQNIPGMMLSSGVMHTVPQNALYVNLYFKDFGKATGDTIKSLVNRMEQKSSEDESVCKDNPTSLTSNNSMLKRMDRVTKSNGVRVYDVNEATRDILSAFMFRPNVKWNDHIREITSPITPYNSKEEIAVQISGLSLDLIISTIYGRNVDGRSYEYEVIPVTTVNKMRDEILLRITQMDRRTIEDLRKSLNLYNQTAQNFHVWGGNR